MTFKIRILIFKIRIRSTIIWWSSENAYVKHPKLLGTWKLPNKYQFSFLTYWWPIQPNILKPRGNLNWKCIYLMFQVCVYWHMCLPVRERRGETRVESGFLREICSFLLLHEFSERDGMLEVEHIELDHRAWAALQTLDDIYYIWQGNGRNGIKYYLCHST